jgi:hypothetical protein
MSALRSPSRGKQTFNYLRRRFAKVNRNWQRFSHCGFAPVVRLGACQFCHDDLDAVSAGFVTAEHHSHPSHRSARSFCDLF